MKINKRKQINKEYKEQERQNITKHNNRRGQQGRKSGDLGGPLLLIADC